MRLLVSLIFIILMKAPVLPCWTADLIHHDRDDRREIEPNWLTKHFEESAV